MGDNLAAFPDLHFEIEQLITEGDLVTARYLVQQLGAVPGPG